MKTIWSKRLLFLAFSLILLLLITVGCSPDPVVPDEPTVDEPVEEPEEIEEEETEAETPDAPPVSVPTYYWPWISHGLLDLSSGEVISGPDLFESELGFIAEFTEDYSYEGWLYWLVEDSDVFELDWVTLSFNVEYYEDYEWQYELNYDFEIDNLQPEPADDGVQEFTVNIVDRQEDFEVTVKRVVLGKEQEGSFTTDPINYIALEIEMQVVANP